MTTHKPVWRAAETAAAGFAFQHPLDQTAQCHMAPVSRMAGLGKVAVNVVTIAAGDTAFPFHTHHGEEEWVYVVSGSAEIRLGNDVHALTDGDFVAFYAGGPAHSVKNAGASDLVCLMGGEQMSPKVVDMPELEKRVTMTDADWAVAPLSAFTSFAAPSPKKGDT